MINMSLQNRTPATPSSALPSVETLCVNPDFTIRLIPQDVSFRVLRSKLAAGSTVFSDMFGVCDPGNDGEKMTPHESPPQEMEIRERPEIFRLLLKVLHGTDLRDPDLVTETHLPQNRPHSEEQAVVGVADVWSQTETITDNGQPEIPNPNAKEITPFVIPLPVLRPLYDMADKYDLTPELHTILHEHLLGNAPQYPLEVYAMATLLGLDKIAAKSSAHLLRRPLATYTMEEIAILPTVQSYHRLVMLHAHRTQKLRETLMAEDIFPHDYGTCSKHSKATKELWQMRKRHLEWRITAGTDISVEMGTLEGSLVHCATCTLAYERAVAMLKVCPSVFLLYYSSLLGANIV